MGSTWAKYGQGMYRLAEQWPFLRYCGLGAWWAWIWTCYSSVALFSQWPAGELADCVGRLYLYSTPAIALALIAAAFMWRGVTPLLARRAVVASVAGLAFAGSLLVAYSPWLGASAFAVGGVLTGLGTSILCLKTGDAYGTLGRHEALTTGCFSLVIAAFLYFTATGLPTAWQPVFAASLPVIGALLFIMPSDDPFTADSGTVREAGLKAPGMRSFVNLVIASVMIAGTASFGKGLATGSMPQGDYSQVGAVMTFTIAVIALVVCIVVNTGDIVRAVRRVYAALILFGVAVVLLSLFGLNLVYLNVGKELLWMIFTCLMAYTAFRFGYSPVRMFGFGQAAYLVSSAVFWLLGMRLAPALSSQSDRLIVTVVMIFAIVGVFAFVFTEADIKFLLTWGRPGGRPADEAGHAATEGARATGRVAHVEGGPSTDASIDMCAEPDAGSLGHDDSSARPILPSAVADAYGLSDRELEVLALFAQGRSANWIAEALTISNNTVRSHLRACYVKLDVHSRQELIDFIGAHRA